VSEARGRAVLAAAIEAARGRLGPRLVAAYALGSLAHGGFSPLVSDVDLGLVVADPLDPADGAEIAALREDVASVDPLAARLSVFWGSPTSLAAGRWPALDRADLVEHGVLLHGTDVRHVTAVPTRLELLVETARLACDVLARPEHEREIVDPAFAVAGGPRVASKAALFPVRFLWTSRDGGVGDARAAAAHYLAGDPPPPHARLVRAALGWRDAWAGDMKEKERLLAAATSLYREFAADYAARLAPAGHAELAGALVAWADRLGASKTACQR
jgi:predicted nucleotidyltransferase